MTDSTVHSNQERRRDKTSVYTTFSHWWHQSASHKWLTLHQLDTCRSRSQGYRVVLIVTWCWYNSFCLPYVRYQEASSSSLNRTVPWRTRRLKLRQPTFPDNFDRCWAILKIPSKQTEQKICNKVMVERPAISKSYYYTICVDNISCYMFQVVSVLLS